MLLAIMDLLASSGKSRGMWQSCCIVPEIWSPQQVSHRPMLPHWTPTNLHMCRPVPVLKATRGTHAWDCIQQRGTSHLPVVGECTSIKQAGASRHNRRTGCAEQLQARSAYDIPILYGHPCWVHDKCICCSIS
jgi:hypothetical protein